MLFYYLTCAIFKCYYLTGKLSNTPFSVNSAPINREPETEIPLPTHQPRTPLCYSITVWNAKVRAAAERQEGSDLAK